MKQDRIRLITWNIRWGRGIDNRVDLDRTIAHIRQFSDFDILCLQEVASGYADPELKYADGANQFETLAEKLPGYYPVSGYAVDQPGTDSVPRRFGNMIFSRYPVLQVFRHCLPWPAEAGTKSMPRMALEVLLQTPLGIIGIINTHLEFHSASQRMAQVEYLRHIYRQAWAHSRLTGKTETGGPFSAYPEITGIILAGDFNFSGTAPERTRLLSPDDAPSPSLADAWEMANPDERHQPTMGLFDSERWPDGPFVSDYIFVSRNLAGHIRNVCAERQSRASDHQALLLELAI